MTSTLFTTANAKIVGKVIAKETALAAAEVAMAAAVLLTVGYVYNKYTEHQENKKK